MNKRRIAVFSIASLGTSIFGMASVFSTGSTSGNVQLDTEIATSIAMKIVSPNDVNPDCTPESGVTYGEVNRYASSTGDDSGKMVDTFNGNEGEADEINTNTSCATLSMTPNTFDSTYSDVTVYTNSGTGYAVTLQSAENTSPNLVNTADNTQYIEAGALTEQDGTGEQAGQKVVPGGQNKWAYKTNNGIITDWTAATTSPVAIKSYDTTTSGGDTTRVTYGISAGSNPTGKYTTILTYTATMFDGANPYVGNVETETVPNLTISPTSLKIARKQTKTLTVTPAEGYYLSDVDCPENYTCSNYTTDKDDPASAETQNIAVKNESAPNTPVTIGLEVSKTTPEFFTISTMQEMTPAVCNSVPTPSASATASMTAANYNASQLVENGSYVAESTLRDVRDNNSYTVRKLADGNCWMTKNLDLAGGTTVEPERSNVAVSYTLPDSSPYGFTDPDTARVYNTNNTICGNTTPCYSYYNYLAVTAGTGTIASIATDGKNATYDICPKGWTLPTKSQGEAIIAKYGSLLTAPLNFDLAGEKNLNDFYGGYAIYTTRTVSSDTRTNYAITQDSAPRIHSPWRKNGLSVRCIAWQN